MRSWIAEGRIETTDLFEEPFKLGNCTIKKEDGMHIYLDIKAKDELELEEIENLVSKEARIVCSALSMATGKLFTFNSFSNIAETTPSKKVRPVSTTLVLKGRVVRPSLKNDQKREALRVFKLLENADEYSLKALDYFEKGLVLAKWPEDAFHNFYKAIELIFNKYFGELEATEIDEMFHKPKQDITTKEKMKYTCNKLGIPREWSEKVDDLVDKRSSQDVAHAKLSKGNIDHNDVFNCMALAKLIIVNHLKTLNARA